MRKHLNKLLAYSLAVVMVVSCMTALFTVYAESVLPEAAWEVFKGQEIILVSKDNGTLQSTAENANENIDYNLVYNYDAENLYIAVATAYAPIAKNANDDSIGNGNSTTVRTWFRTDAALNKQSHLLDVCYNGTDTPVVDSSSKFDEATRATIKAEGAVIDGKWFVQIKVPFAAIGDPAAFDMFVTVSNGKDTTDGANYNALFYPKCDPAKLCWNGWDSAKDITIKTHNYAHGKSYSFNGFIAGSYHSDDTTRLTDGIIPETDDYYEDNIVGLHGNNDFYTPNGYARVLVDLGKVVELNELAAVISNANKDGIGAPSAVTYLYSEDGEKFYVAGKGTYENGKTVGVVRNALTTKINARFIEVRFERASNGSWMMISEIEALGKATVTTKQAIKNDGAFNFMNYAKAVNINAPISGECISIFTKNESFGTGGWSICVLLKGVEGKDGVYEVVNAPVVLSGTPYSIPLNEGEILLCVHSSSSQMSDIGTYQNVPGKNAAMALKVGDRLTIKGISDGTITALYKGEDAGATDIDIVVPADLSKLIDGVYADDATAFGDARLLNLNNKAFDYSPGAENGKKKASLILDLGEIKGVTGLKIGAYKERNSFVDLPSAVKAYLSEDGVNYIAVQTGSWTSSVEGLVANNERNGGGLQGGCTYTADWSVRANLLARFVKIEFELTDPFIFLSEIEALVAPKAGIAFDGTDIDDIPLIGIDCLVPGEGVVVITSEAGEISLDKGVETGDFKNVRMGNLTWAKWDDNVSAYIVYKNECNPWPDTRTGSLKVAPDEIVITSVSTGNAGYDFAGEKWVMRFIDLGTVIRIHNNALRLGTKLPDPNRTAYSYIYTPVAPTAKSDLPEGYITVNRAGFHDGSSIVIMSGANQTIAQLTERGTGTASDLANSYNILVGADNKVIAVDYALGTACTFTCPEGGYILSYNSKRDDKPDELAAFKSIEVGAEITLYNIKLDGVGVISGNPKFTNGAFTFANPSSIQPETLETLPEGAIVIDNAGYKHAGTVSIIAGDNETVAQLTERGHGTAKDLNYAYNILVDKNNKVIAVDFVLSSACTFTCPEGGYIISYNGNKADFAVMNAIEVGATINVYNVLLDGVRTLEGNKDLVSAGFTYENPGKVQPATLETLPEGAIVIDFAGYKHAGAVSIIAGDNETVAQLTERGHGTAKDLNYAYNILVDKNNKVIAVDFALSSACTFTCPEGGYIISYNGNKADFAVMSAIEVGATINVYNVLLEGVRTLEGNKELASAGFTYENPTDEFTPPAWHAATENDIGIIAIDETTYEGTTYIITSGNVNKSWVNIALLEWDAKAEAYKVIGVYPSSGTATVFDLEEGQIAVVSNLGNNWPELFESANGTEWYYNAETHGVSYKDCPNFCAGPNAAWYANVGGMTVESYYKLVGADSGVLSNYKLDSTFAYATKNDYATYTYLEKFDYTPVPEAPAMPEGAFEQLKDKAFVYVDKETGSLQLTTAADVPFFAAYAVEKDFVYFGIATTYAPIGSPESNGNGNGTNLRLWFHTDPNAAKWTHLADIAFDGDETPVITGKCADGFTIDISGITANAVIIDGILFMQAKVPVEAVAPNGDFGMYLTLSNGKTESISNNAIHYPKCDTFAYTEWDTAHEIVVAHEAVPTYTEPTGTNIAKDKPYTATTPNESYPDTDGKELTDGKYPATSAYADGANVGFHGSEETIAANGYAVITIDLGADCLITDLVAAFTVDTSAGVGAPGRIEFYTSNDNATFTLAGKGIYNGNVKENGLFKAILNLDEGSAARYIQVRTYKEGYWMFINEVEVYGEEPVQTPDVQPETLETLPEGAIVIDNAGYKHAGTVSIIAGDNETVAQLTERGHGTAKDLNYAYNILVDKNNKVIAVDFVLSSACTFTCPEGGYIISYNGNKAGYAVMNAIEVDATINVYNVLLDGVRALEGNKDLVSAGFTYTNPEPPKPIENADYDFTENASDIKLNGTVTGEDIVVFTNAEAIASGNCRWSVNLLLKPTDKVDVYEVVSVAAGDGTDPVVDLTGGLIYIAVHSDGVGQNKDGKAAALELTEGRLVHIDGLSAGTITQLYSEKAADEPQPGDAGLAALAILSVIALAGAVVIKKHK